MRYILFILLFSVFPSLYAQVGASVIVEHNPMDISGFNAVISDELGEPVVSNASAFLKFGAGFDFQIEKFTLGLLINNFSSSKENRVDTTYFFQNVRWEINFGYLVLQNQKLALEPYLGWALNNTSYNKIFNINYSSLGDYWNSRFSNSGFRYNLHNLNAGLRIHFQKFPVNKNAAFGISLRAGVLIPFSNGNIKFLNQKTNPDQKLVEQSFYIGLITTIGTL